VAIASKNDPVVAEAALRRDDMVLKPEHVFPTLVHWRRKSESVDSILKTWNIAADSVIFVDDSPIELAEVQSHHPDLQGVLFPKEDPRAVVELLRQLRDSFGKPMLLDEDRLRRDSIRRSADVRDAAGSDGTEQFLSQLESVVTLDFRSNPNDARAFELLNKTNHFNLNGKRLSDGEWRAFLERPDSFVLRVSYRDKFGPLGNIAVLAGTVSDSSLVMRHWVMSCRAFARRIEHQALRAVFEQFSVESIELEFRPTERNEPTRTFLAGFIELEATDELLTLTRERFDGNCPPSYHAIEYTGREIKQHV
jgi:FkbH-like protein